MSASNLFDGRDIAKARDEYFKSDEGRRIQKPDLLRDPDNARFLRNRLELAFLAGVEAGARLAKGGIAE